MSSNLYDPSHPDITAVVSASAGTGKTYLLVSRIIRLLLSGAKPEHILALTFTRKAAGEMQERLYARLQALSVLDDAALNNTLQAMQVDASKTHRQQARELYEKLLFAERPLRISTFHAFCQELLRRFPMEAGIPPGFELLETTAILEDTAWQALFLRATREPGSQIAQALEVLFNACNGLSNTRSALLDGFLNHRSDWWAFTEGQDQPLKHAISQLRQQLDFNPNALTDFFNPALLEDINNVKTLLEQHPTATNLKHASFIASALNISDASGDLTQYFEWVKKAFLTAKLEPLQRKHSKALESKLGASGVEQLLSLHQGVCAAILATHEQCIRKEAFHVNHAWFTAGEALLAHYQQLKQQQRLLDFADLEWYSYTLLNTQEQALWVQFKLDQKIEHLLVDEFQDTNPTQWQLILPLLTEMASGQQERARSVFLVGDSKQSIYGFRRANPRLQQTATDWLTEHLHAAVFPLSKSWRSSPAIMQCLNAVFTNTRFAAHLQDYQIHDTHQQDYWGCLELLPLICVEPEVAIPIEDIHIGELRDPLTQARSTQRDSAYYLEGQAIAQHIHTLLSKNYCSASSGTRSPLGYGDIYILFRNRTHIGDYERALIDANIPFIGSEKGTLLESLEITDIEALLNTLVTPYNNLALAQVLRCPIFSASDTDLQLLAAADNNLNWYERLLQYPSDNLSAALQRASRLLSQWRELLGQLPIHDLLDRIYYEGDVIQRYRQATPKEKQNRVSANLNLLLEMALEMDSGRYPSLMRFLARLNALRNSVGDQPDAANSTDARPKVQLLTIHAAKGLEAAVVYLADCASNRGRADAYYPLIDWPAEQARPQSMLLCTTSSKTPEPLKQLQQRQQRLNEDEQANLLYVALSRARHHLIVSGSISNSQQDNLGWYGDIEQALSDDAELLDDGRRILRYAEPTAADKQIHSTKINESSSEQIDKIIPTKALLSRIQLAEFENSLAPSHQSGIRDAYSDSEFETVDARQQGIALHAILEKLSYPAAQQVSDAEHELGLPAYTISSNNTQTVISFNQQSIESLLGNTLDTTQYQAWLLEAATVIKQAQLQFLFDPAQFIQAYKEVPLSFQNHNGNTIHGIVDRIVITQDTVWVIDYKTHKEAEASTAKTLAAHYQQQLQYYAQGASKLWPEKTIKTALLFTKTALLYEMT